MKLGWKKLFFLIIVLFLFNFQSVGADTIDFSSLSGPNGTTFTGTTEGNFDVGTESGEFYHAFNIGNPTPGLWSWNSGSLGVTENTTGLFTFSSIDFGTGSGGSYDYTLTGLLGGSIIFDTGATFTGSAFQTFSNSHSSLVIDELVILFDNLSISSVNVDNIVVDSAPVPEPATMLLFGIGLLGLAGVNRRKK